jgi:AraC-like DNA-binding protein
LTETPFPATRNKAHTQDERARAPRLPASGLVQQGDGMATSVIQRVTNKAVGQLLIDRGFLTQAKCDEALELARSSGQRIGQALVQLGYISHDLLSAALAEQFGVMLMDLDPSMLDVDLVRRAPPDLLRRHNMLPVLEMGDEVVVAIADPNDHDGLQALASLMPGKQIVTQLADPVQIRRCLDAPELEVDLDPPSGSALEMVARTERLLGADEPDAIVEWIALQAVEEPGADILVRAGETVGFVARVKQDDGGAPAVERLRTLPMSFVPVLREAIRARTWWFGGSRDEIGFCTGVLPPGSGNFRIQVAFLRDAAGSTIRIRAIRETAPRPSAEDLDAAGKLVDSMTLLAYDNLERLEFFLSALTDRFGESDMVTVFQETTRCIFRNATIHAGVTENPLASIARTCPTLVVFDYPSPAATLEHARTVLRYPPRLVTCAPVGTGGQPQIPADLHRLLLASGAAAWLIGTPETPTNRIQLAGVPAAERETE